MDKKKRGQVGGRANLVPTMGRLRIALNYSAPVIIHTSAVYVIDIHQFCRRAFVSCCFMSPRALVTAHTTDLYVKHATVLHLESPIEHNPWCFQHQHTIRGADDNAATGIERRF